MAASTNVMLVEDSEDIRELVAHLLSDEGHFVYSFANGFDAIDSLINGFKPDLILLDWRMPILSGKEFIEKYKNTFSVEQRSPIYLFSAEDDPRIFSEYGCAGVVKKPINVEKLLQVVSYYSPALN